MTSLSQRSFAIAALIFAAGAALAEAASDARSPKTTAPDKKTAAVHGDPGERAFQANCSRCHQAPESLPPRITGTVVRHMRVRANLSAEDERLILAYLNP